MTVRDIMKNLRASTLELGVDCECTKCQCFKKISGSQRLCLIKQFSELVDWNKQSAHLAGLITMVRIKWRYAKDEANATLRDCSFRYMFKVKVDDTYVKEEVHRQEFMELHRWELQQFKLHWKNWNSCSLKKSSKVYLPEELNI